MSTLPDLIAALDAARDAMASLSDAEVVDSLTLAGHAKRLVDGLIADLAGEASSRCYPKDLTSPDAARGYRNPKELIQHSLGVEPGEAAEYQRVGVATRQQTALTGEPLPPTHPHVTAAISEGALTLSAASLILTTLTKAAPHLDHDETVNTEQALVEVAPPLSLAQLRAACRRVMNWIDPDGAEPTEEALRAKAFLLLREQADGMTSITGRLTPEQAAYLIAALNARTALRRAPRFTEDLPLATDGDGEDRRTRGARNADALTGIARDALTHDDGQHAGVPVTVLVTMTLEQLQGAAGASSIEGIDHPISAGTARRMAANANLIPVVLGTKSEPLDLGTTARLASPTQRRALQLRDHGCIWTHCDHPPGPTEVAHLTPWASGGPTDLNNLALMCHFHHTLYDTHGWNLHTDNTGQRWLIPPAHVDPTRTPQRAGPVVLPHSSPSAE